MNPLRFESALAKAHKYKKLPKELSDKLRAIYQNNIPTFLNMNGGGALYSKNGYLICEHYDRIVVGDYGAFVEFSVASVEFVTKRGQEYRRDPKYSNVKYYWLTLPKDDSVKIYFQKKEVTYADYKPEKYYVSVHEVKTWVGAMLGTVKPNTMTETDSKMFTHALAGGFAAQRILETHEYTESDVEFVCKAFIKLIDHFKEKIKQKYND